MDDEIILNKFSERLFKLVKENDTNINVLAQKMGIKSKSTIYRYMNAEMSPKLTTVKYLAEFYNVNPVWLMGYDVPMEKQLQENTDKKNTNFHDEEYHGLNTEGLTDEDIEDIKAYIEMRRNINKSKNKQ